MIYAEWLSWWQERASTYFTDKVFKFSRPDLIERLDFPPDGRVLEVGYGYGRELSQWARKTDQAYGVELSPETQELAFRELRRQKLPAKRMPCLVNYDGKRLPFQDGFFDVVYSCFMLQHLSREHAREMLAESLRVLSSCGLMLHEFFGDPAFWNGGQDVFSGDPENGGMFNNSYRREEIIALAEEIGVIEWLEPWPITAEWGNWWLCLGKPDKTVG